jgi:hypothetical protein
LTLRFATQIAPSGDLIVPVGDRDDEVVIHQDVSDERPLAQVVCYGECAPDRVRRHGTSRAFVTRTSASAALTIKVRRSATLDECSLHRTAREPVRNREARAVRPRAALLEGIEHVVAVIDPANAPI